MLRRHMRLVLSSLLLLVMGCTGVRSGLSSAKLCPEQARDPRPIAGIPPQHPSTGPCATCEGYAAARCIVTVEGTLRDCHLLYGPPRLGELFFASLDTVRFDPPTLCGAPAERETVVRYYFQLTPEEKAAREALAESRVPSDKPRTFDVERMTRPVQVSGDKPQYTSEAIEKRAQGELQVRCIIRKEGNVDQCWVIKSIPSMDEAVIRAVHTHLYKPATLDGEPIDVEYTFNVRLTLPRR